MYKHNSGDQEEENNEWYYFSPRYRKYPKGSRPRRSAGDGYWKATGRETQIKDVRNTIIGIRKTLVFYKGKPPMGVKTNWVMREYTLNNPPPLRPNSDPMIVCTFLFWEKYKKALQTISRLQFTLLMFKK